MHHGDTPTQPNQTKPIHSTNSPPPTHPHMQVFPRYQRAASVLYELLGVVSLEEVVARVADLMGQGVGGQGQGQEEEEAV